MVLPDNADYNTGAMMGIPAMTAHRCVFADGDVGSQIVLVTGGAGRVYAVQWAKQNGATVIATASSESVQNSVLMLVPIWWLVTLREALRRY